MKQKFGSKTSKGNSVSRDEPAPVQNSRQAVASTSGISGRAGSISRNNSLPVREKIPQPSLDPASAQQFYADTLPSFRDVPNSEKQALFIKKLHLCAFTFDFTDQSKNVREKEVKRQTLLELADYINQKDGAKFTESVAEDVIFMLNNNLFRALPATKSHDQDNLDPDEEEPTLEPAWPHLQVSPTAFASFVFRTGTLQLPHASDHMPCCRLCTSSYCGTSVPMTQMPKLQRSMWTSHLLCGC